MNEPTINCPKCNTEIKLTESLAAPLIEATRKQYEQQLAAKESDINAREQALKAQQEAVEKAKQSIDDQVSTRVASEREKIASEEARKARLVLANDLDTKSKEIASLQEVLQERDSKLAEAQKAQAELIKKQRELDDAKREMDLTIEKRVQASLEQIRERARHDAEEGLKLKLTEKEEQISGMQRQIEELKRKAEQGSQQLQGEALELELEASLRSRFPFDSIEPVPKGEFGGDVLQRVVSPGGLQCGSILWESKRTKNWTEGWLAKLRGDQRAAKAELAVIVSQSLPKDVNAFDFIDGVWVVEPRCAMPVAIALRQSLIDVAASRQVQEGQQGKMELMYQYLTGPRFRHRVEAIIEKFSDMQDDLNKEKRATMRLWAKREAQIQGVLEATVGMYGDMQGIAGRAMQEIDALAHPLLESELKGGDSGEDKERPD